MSFTPEVRVPRLAAVTAVALAMFIIGCTKDEVPTGTIAPRRAAQRTVAQEPTVRDGERTLADISRSVPSYGGHFIDASGVLTAYATAPESFGAITAAIMERVASGAITLPPGTPRGAVRVIKGEYTFTQLASWRDSIFAHVLDAKIGVFMDDLDEAKNRVTIGVERASASSIEAQIRPKLAEYGIPEGAVVFEPVSRLRRASHSANSPRRIHAVSNLENLAREVFFHLIAASAPVPTPPALLYGQADTLFGGLRIQYYHTSDAVYKDCTIGFTAQLANGTHGFITASHCSSNMWATDGANYYQPSSAYSVRGYEAYDRSPGTCPVLWPCDVYRFSDANLDVASGNWRRGIVGRTNGSPVNGSAGTTVINGTNPYLFVVGVSNDVIEGQRVDKIGSYSGWTYGTVTHTCGDWVDYLGLATEMVRCVYKASVYTQGGDSGSPVFTWDGADGIVAYGILFAEDDANQTMYFSKWPNVAGDVADGNYTSSVNILTDVTMSGSPSLSGSLSGGVQLSWSSVTVSGASATTEYKIYRSVWDASTYTLVNDGTLVGTTTGTSFTDTTLPISVSAYLGTSGPPAMCTYSYAIYSVVAYNSGLSATSPVIYFRGNADGATPWQIICP